MPVDADRGPVGKIAQLVEVKVEPADTDDPWPPPYVTVVEHDDLRRRVVADLTGFWFRAARHAFNPKGARQVGDLLDPVVIGEGDLQRQLPGEILRDRVE